MSIALRWRVSLAGIATIRLKSSVLDLKCILAREFGTPADVLTVEDSPVPEPGPSQVRIRMCLSPIHRHDLMSVTGRYGSRPALPLIPGTEGFGIVDKVGSAVGRFTVGQRVAAMSKGVWAEYFLAEAQATVPVDDSIEDVVAAQLVAMPLSVRLLIDHLKPKPAEWLIYNAANGAVGRLIESMADEVGFNTVGLSRQGGEKLERSAERCSLIVGTEAAGWKETIHRLAGRRFARYGIDSVGGHASNEMADFLMDGGRLVSFGMLSGRPLEIDAAHLIFRQINLEGFWANRNIAKLDVASLRAHIKETLSHARLKNLPVPVDSVYNISSIRDAILRATAPSLGGKVLLSVQ